MQIDYNEYKRLEKAARKLEALEAGGVDNWEWYDESLKEFYKDDRQEEAKEQFLMDIQENLLVDGVDVDYPAGWEAGHSVTLTQEGQDQFMCMLERFIRAYMEE